MEFVMGFDRVTPRVWRITEFGAFGAGFCAIGRRPNARIKVRAKP